MAVTGDLIVNAPIQHEPKQKHRWVMRFPSSIGIQEWQLAAAARPKIGVGEAEIKFLNMTKYVATKPTYEQLSVKLVDYIGPSTMQAAMEWLRLCIEAVTGRMGYAAGYMKDLELEMQDPTGVAIEKWVYQEAWITSLDGGSLDYSDATLCNIDLTIRYARPVMLF